VYAGAVIKYAAQRIALSLVLLWVVVTFTFLLLQFVPGDPAAVILGGQGTPSQIAQLRGQLGLDRPVIAQYGTWLGNVLHADLGRSVISGQSVSSILNQRAPVTISLALAATLVSVVVGVGMGILAAVRGGWVDRTVRFAAGLGAAVPNFWLGALLVLVFSVWLGILPSVGYTSLFRAPVSWARYMVLPIAAVAAASVAGVARQTRASMSMELQSDYVQTLRGAGLSRRSIVYKHALRNASIPIVTVVGWLFVGLLGGAVLVEQVFALPGLGQATVQAISTNDIPVLQGLVIYTTVIVLIVNLLIDLAYAWLNPKVGHP
jgi:peptide/nickel transport system permease protein